ncbi:tRNA modification GTPase MnmE [Tanacetum coccineum]
MSKTVAQLAARGYQLAANQLALKDARQFRNLQNNSAMSYKLATFAQQGVRGVRSGGAGGGRIGVVVILIQVQLGEEGNTTHKRIRKMLPQSGLGLIFLYSVENGLMCKEFVIGIGSFSSLVRSLRAQCIEFLTEIVARLDFDDEMMPVDMDLILSKISAMSHVVESAMETANYDKFLQSGLQVEVNRNNENKECYDEATGVVITKQVSTDWAHFIMRKPVLPRNRHIWIVEESKLIAASLPFK